MIEIRTTRVRGKPIRAVGAFETGVLCEIAEVLSPDGDAFRTVTIRTGRGFPPLLSRENAADLWPILKRFAETGRIDEPQGDETS